MVDRLAVCDLARELGVHSADVIYAAKKLGINVNRAAALLTDNQARRLRRANESGFLTRRTVRRRPPPPEPPPRELEYSRCTCCDVPFTHKIDERPRFCDRCHDHYEIEGESPKRTIARLSDHLDPKDAWLDSVTQKNNELERRVDAAYRKRDKWMQALTEVVVAHEMGENDGDCVCGAGPYPCVTRRRQVPEVEFGRVLYGRGYAFFEDWDDDQQLQGP